MGFNVLRSSFEAKWWKLGDKLVLGRMFLERVRSSVEKETLNH